VTIVKQKIIRIETFNVLYSEYKKSPQS